MTIHDLIFFLEGIEDKTLPVFLYGMEGIMELNKEMIDINISDRVDINIPSEFQESL